MKKKIEKKPSKNEIKIHCKYDELVDPAKLKNHPKNRNAHGDDQIERLAELYKFHGVRHPVIVSKLSDKIVVGHGRILAALRAGIKEFPVVHQDFKDEAAEYAFMVSDNAISEWSELDLKGIDEDFKALDADFSIDLLGVKNLSLDLKEDQGFDPDSTENDKKEKLCPHCGEVI